MKNSKKTASKKPAAAKAAAKPAAPKPIKEALSKSGLVAHLSETTVDVPIGDVLQDDYGVSYAPGRVTHNLSLYRDAASGALVFGAGTVQWSWGLDDEHDGSAQVANVPMRQATVNLFGNVAGRTVSLSRALLSGSMMKRR